MATAQSTLIRLASALSLAAVMAAAGCQSGVYDENVELHHQARKLQANNTQLRNELKTRPDESQLASMQQQLSERDRMIADLQARLNQPDASGVAITGLEGIEIIVDENNREMTMRVPGDVLFASGSTKINASADKTLGRIADILNSEYAGKSVRVVGHTDSDPISKTKNLYSNNRDLSLQRALSVTGSLEKRGVEPSRILAGGMGQYKSLGTDKKKDRRVEIVVVM